jgi:hypothetical protein
VTYPSRTEDPALWEVVDTLSAADPDGERAARVFRDTFDQLYDGEHTGRYSVEQLNKTEKTHCGTLIEINLRRQFRDIVEDGDTRDYRIAGQDIDCKFSLTDGGWMLPPESLGVLLMVSTADDACARWSLGVVRATRENVRTSANRDAKTSLNRGGRQAIYWVHRLRPMPENVLLSLDAATREAIMTKPSGQARINELFRVVTGRRIGRGVIATVAQQRDYMKRVRDDGGARSALRGAGYLILGDYAAHRQVAAALGIVVPQRGEFVSVRVVPCEQGEVNAVEIEGRWWRASRDADDVTVEAPVLPSTRHARSLPSH